MDVIVFMGTIAVEQLIRVKIAIRLEVPGGLAAPAAQEASSR